MFVGQSSFFLEGRKVPLAEQYRHNDRLMWLYNLMFANYYESKFAWRLTFSLDWFSCLKSSAQRRLPDFTASTRISDKFKMADAADDATVTRFSKWEAEYSIEDVDRLAFLRIMTSSKSLGFCRSKTWRITSRIGACQACLHLMYMFTDVCACEIRRREVNEACRCACVFMSESSGFSLFLCFFNFFFRFIKWVLDVRWPKLFHFGGKKGRTRRMDADNGRDNRVTDFALIRKWSSHASSLVLTLDRAIPSGHAHWHA